jgi:glycogen(starch) synthase
LPALRDRGLEISVVTSHYHLDLPDRCHLDGVAVYRVPMRAALVGARVDELADVAHQITRIKREVSPDVVHVSGVGPGAVFHLMTERAFPAPFLVSLRTEVLGSQKERNASLLERALRRADWITAVSAEVLKQARELTPAIADRSSVVYNFLHAPDWTPSPLPFAPPRLLCVGRLIPAKGFDLAVKAFASVVIRHPDARLVLVGDGPEREGLERERLVRDLRLGGAVEVAGPVAPSRLPDLLGSATLVLVPSRREGLPMVAVEAGMMARPVVAARVGGLPEVIVDGRTGVLVPPEDARALAHAVCALLADPSRTTELGRRARARVQAMFARDRCVDAHLEVYRGLSRENGRGRTPTPTVGGQSGRAPAAVS